MGAGRRIRQRMRRAVQETAQRRDADVAAGETTNVNVADPTNIVVSGTTGGNGAVHATSSRQTVRGRQDGNETYEESETITETRSS